MATDEIDEYLNRSGMKENFGGSRNPHIADGRYLFTLVNFTMEQKRSGMLAIPELFVEESGAPSYKVPDGEPGPNAKGTKCSVVWNLSHATAGDSAAGNLLSFVLALPDAEPQPKHPQKGGDFKAYGEWVERYKKFTKSLRAPEQPGRGMQVRCETYRNAKGYVNLSWTLVPNQSIETMKAARARLAEAGF